MTRKKILIVVDDRWNGTPKVVEKVAKDFEDIEAHLLYVRDIENVTPELVIELEKKYDYLKKQAMEKLQKVSEELRRLGLKANVLGFHYGIAVERILREAERLRPDYILVRARKRPLLRRLLGEYFYDELFRKSRVPILVGR